MTRDSESPTHGGCWQFSVLHILVMQVNNEHDNVLTGMTNYHNGPQQTATLTLTPKPNCNP